MPRDDVPETRTGVLLTGDAGEAEDLLQETFLAVASRWDRVRSMEHPVAYARRVLTNLVLDGVNGRGRRRAELTGWGDLDERPDDRSLRVLRGVDDLAEFRWALAVLDRRQRAVLVLRYWDDLSEAEIAQVLGCPVGTVKSTAARGLERLRCLMGRVDRSPPRRLLAAEGREPPC